MTQEIDDLANASETSAYANIRPDLVRTVHIVVCHTTPSGSHYAQSVFLKDEAHCKQLFDALKELWGFE